MQNAKLYLAEALIDLMGKKALDEIHVKDLVERAGVSRQTYYRYFVEKEEILHFYMQYMFDSYMENIETSAKGGFQSYEHILQSLQFFEQYKDFALCLHKAGLSGLMMDALNEYVRNQPNFDENKVTHSYPFYYYAGALYNIYMQWVFEDMKTPAEELARIISKMKIS